MSANDMIPSIRLPISHRTNGNTQIWRTKKWCVVGVFEKEKNRPTWSYVVVSSELLKLRWRQNAANIIKYIANHFLRRAECTHGWVTLYTLCGTLCDLSPKICSSKNVKITSTEGNTTQRTRSTDTWCVCVVWFGWSFYLNSSYDDKLSETEHKNTTHTCRYAHNWVE